MASDDKRSKRSRLGNRVQRGVYRSAHAYMHPWYDALCVKAYNLNYKGSGGEKKVEAHLNVELQAQITAERRKNRPEWAR